jgi:hypothetical protein
LIDTHSLEAAEARADGVHARRVADAVALEDAVEAELGAG